MTTDHVHIAVLEELRGSVDFNAAYDPKAQAKRAALDAAIAALTASPQAAPEGELSDRDVLAHRLDSQGFHYEAQNVREGIDLDSYEDDLRLIAFARNFALASPQVQGEEAVDRKRFERAPCYLCGYNGEGYYQASHPCAAKYHAATPQRAPGVSYCNCPPQRCTGQWPVEQCRFHAMRAAGLPACHADLASGPSGVDWQAQYRLQTAMRYMDNDPKLTTQRAYAMADEDIRRMLAPAAQDQGEGNGRD